MNIHEYQAKELAMNMEIPIPRGRLARTQEEAEKIAEELGGRIVIKAQVHCGGRGKAGGVKIAETPGEAFKKAGEILGMKIKGLTVNCVLVEKAKAIKQELYLGITLDRSKSKNVIMFSPMGGVDIEEVAVSHPDMIFRQWVDPLTGLSDFHIRNLFYPSGLGHKISDLEPLVRKLYALYTKYDCTLAEINPLVIEEDGGIMMLDGKINIDDNALYRQKDLLKYREFAEEDPIELEAKKRGIAYVRLKGDVGIMGNGAGLVMCTLDMVARAGGKPANFLDIGGGAKQEIVEKSIELVLMDSDVKGLFLNIFGGITRCDEVAKGIVSAVNNLGVKVPVVIRLAGTNESAGKQVLREAGFPIVNTMQEGAERIVEMIKGKPEVNQKMVA